MFNMQFKTTNAAFAESAEYEAATIVRHIAGLIEDGYTNGPITDTNGNTIGSWECTIDAEQEDEEE